MYDIFADLHVHIGRSESGKPIKITAARTLNFANIAKECDEKVTVFSISDGIFSGKLRKGPIFAELPG